MEDHEVALRYEATRWDSVTTTLWYKSSQFQLTIFWRMNSANRTPSCQRVKIRRSKSSRGGFDMEWIESRLRTRCHDDESERWSSAINVRDGIDRTEFNLFDCWVQVVQNQVSERLFQSIAIYFQAVREVVWWRKTLHVCVSRRCQVTWYKKFVKKLSEKEHVVKVSWTWRTS